MVARYPSNNAKPAPGRPSPRPVPTRPDSPRPRGVPSGPGRGYSHPLPDLPPGTKAALGLILRRVAPRFIPVVGNALLLADLYQFATGLGNRTNSTNWIVVQTCNGGVPNNSVALPLFPCSSYQANVSSPGRVVPSSWYSRVNPASIAVGGYLVERVCPIPGSNYNTTTGTWPSGATQVWQKTGATAVKPGLQPAPLSPTPIVWPAIQPATAPIAWPYNPPAPRAQPTPLEQRQPAEEPSERPQEPRRRPPEPNPVYRHPPLPTPLIVVSPEVTQHIDVLPNDVVITQPPTSNQPPVVVVDNSNPASPTPPPKGTVQRKVNVAIVGGLVWTGINTVTEAFDFILAMHDSLPKHLQLSKKASKRMKLLYMMKNWEVWKHIDAAEAIENYINMQVEDYVSAVGSDWTKGLAQLTGSLTGVDRALAQHESRIFDATGHSRADFTPSLDIDMASGRVTLTWAGYPLVVYEK